MLLNFQDFKWGNDGLRFKLLDSEMGELPLFVPREDFAQISYYNDATRVSGNDVAKIQAVVAIYGESLLEANLARLFLHFYRDSALIRQQISFDAKIKWLEEVISRSLDYDFLQKLYPDYKEKMLPCIIHQLKQQQFGKCLLQ